MAIHSNMSYHNELPMVIIEHFLKIIPYLVFVGIATRYADEYNKNHDTKIDLSLLNRNVLVWFTWFLTLTENALLTLVFIVVLLSAFIGNIKLAISVSKILKKPMWYVPLAFIPIARLFVLNSYFKAIEKSAQCNQNQTV